MAGIADSIYINSPVWIQQGLTAAYGWYWYRRRYGDIFHKFVAELRSHEQWIMAQHHDYQEQQLKMLLDKAWNSPYYRDVFTQCGITADTAPFEALEQLPILTKAELHEHALDLVTETPLPRDARFFRSSGTTGTPTEIIHPRSILEKGQGWIEARSRQLDGSGYALPAGHVWRAQNLPL